MKAFFVAAALSLAALPASASVIFDFSGNSPDSASKSFTVDGLTVTVTAGAFGTGNPATINYGARRVDQKHDGLGADRGFFEDDEVDNIGPDDILVFTFDHVVTISRIGFKQARIGGNYLLGLVDGTSFDIEGGNRSANNGWNTVAGTLTGTTFGISAVRFPPLSEFRIEKLDVAKVPLPAGVALLGLGLIGLGGARVVQRRKEA